MNRFYIDSFESLCSTIHELGILPYFRNCIEGFSIEENVSPELWFGECEGIWEWKGPVIKETHCAYGKFFGKKAVFIDKALFPDFANWRRDGYDFDARYDDGLAKHSDKVIYDLTAESCPIISKQLRQAAEIKGFDGIITRLQSQGYIITSDFVYMTDRNGCRYGWGVAEYSTPESFFRSSFTESVYSKEPEISKQFIKEHIMKMTGTDEKTADKFMK